MSADPGRKMVTYSGSDSVGAGYAPGTIAGEIAAWITDNRAELDRDYVLGVLSLGLPHLIFALDAIIDSIDSRLGDIEKRLDAAGIARPPGGVGDDEEEKYFALYALNDPDPVHTYGRWDHHRRGCPGSSCR